MLNTPQPTTTENKTSAAEQTDEKTDKDTTTENNEEQGQENTGEEGNNILQMNLSTTATLGQTGRCREVAIVGRFQ